MNEIFLIQKHDEILNYLLEYKRTHNEFTFSLRRNHNDHNTSDTKKCRLCKGYWFQGASNYIYVPLYKIGCKDNKTKTIGFVFTEDRQYIEIVYKNVPEISEDELKFYEELVSFLKDSPEISDVEQKSKEQYFCILKSADQKENLNYFINKFRLKANELLQKYKLVDRYMISENEFQQMLLKVENIKNRWDEEVSQEYKEGSTPMKTVSQIKNIILYGSPGVGKTHNTNKLISLIESRIPEKKIFETIKNNEENNGVDIRDIKDRVKFITFHQSFGYEDFIEGFRPNEEGNIELEKGIFLKICKEAEENLLKSGEHREVTFLDAFNTLFKEKIENEENIEFALKRAGSSFKVYDYNDKTIYFEKQSGNTNHTLSIATLEKMYHAEQNRFINGGLAVYYQPILNKLLEIKRESIVEKVELKNYYLVIDEINRGNISKIFGELITLIEEDKRDTLEVTLPYSKKPFKIPSNLYIIGTMNSTDKSIALIDIALRRRFTFIKMKPKSDLVPEIARDLFIKLNEEITKKLGEDYQIGHSYFMNIQNNNDLEFTLEYKIKPLLEEYFYGDDQGYKSMIAIIDNGNDLTDGTLEG